VSAVDDRRRSAASTSTSTSTMGVDVDAYGERASGGDLLRLQQPGASQPGTLVPNSLIRPLVMPPFQSTISRAADRSRRSTSRNVAAAGLQPRVQPGGRLVDGGQALQQLGSADGQHATRLTGGPAPTGTEVRSTSRETSSPRPTSSSRTVMAASRR
jgi:hypothetical protein